MIIDAFEGAGVKIINKKPEAHDLLISGIGQNSRGILLESLGLLMEKYEVSAKELYEISPPPTRILIDLLARQVGESNDELYEAMRDYNPLTPEIVKFLSDSLGKTERDAPRRIREIFGEEFLKESQKRAALLIEKTK